jgi:hypothetical protein
MAKYFIAVFGDPRPEGKSLVESGQYDPDPRYAPFHTKPGDVMLLYCTGSYGKYSMQLPGLGIVLDTDDKVIRYRWLPFKEPIPKTKIDKSFESADAARFKLIYMSSQWLGEISQLSFSRTVAEQMIDWDRL